MRGQPLSNLFFVALAQTQRGCCCGHGLSLTVIQLSVQLFVGHYTSASALTFLESNTTQLRRGSFDPNNLPHRSLKAEQAIPPKLTREEWDKALFADFAGPTDSANARKDTPVDSKNVARNTPPEPSVRLAASEGGHGGPPLQSLGTAPPTPGDLAETIEVK